MFTLVILFIGVDYLMQISSEPIVGDKKILSFP